MLHWPESWIGGFYLRWLKSCNSASIVYHEQRTLSVLMSWRPILNGDKWRSYRIALLIRCVATSASNPEKKFSSYSFFNLK